jgi:hypothetical protein
LTNYEDAYWSSGLSDLNEADFAPATDVIRGLATSLAQAADELWEIILSWIGEIADSSLYGHHFTRGKFESAASGERFLDERYVYDGGTIEYRIPYPRTPPSAIHYWGTEDDIEPNTDL